MRITFDPAKRARTLQERGLDFADAGKVFAGKTLDRPDIRQDYGEERIVTVGHLASGMVVLVWTPRGDTCHIISMRKANDREQARYEAWLD
jgi:uncharacterized DUF497 family protein